MAALKEERDTVTLASGGLSLVLPVRSGVTIYQGALVALDANGFATPASKAAGLTAAGRAEETVQGGDTDGLMHLRVRRGVFVFANSGTTGSKLTQAHLLKPCYMEDDQTVSCVATGSSVAGLVVRVSDVGVAVEIMPALCHPATT